MTVSVDRQGRERIDSLKAANDGKKYIYESPDNGKTIYRREIKNHDDVSGIKVESNDGWAAYDEATERIEELENKVKHLNSVIDKIKGLVSLL
tara:strand:+ start:358 stop:636 length:279 start_codon:yes stop_codon:yes gene_type:complete